MNVFFFNATYVQSPWERNVNSVRKSASLRQTPPLTLSQRRGVWCPERSSLLTLALMDQLHHSASIYCRLPKQSCLLSGFEAPPDPMPRFQRPWPGSGAVSFTCPIKMSVARPDGPVMSASPSAIMDPSVCRPITSVGGLPLCQGGQGQHMVPWCRAC